MNRKCYNEVKPVRIMGKDWMKEEQDGLLSSDVKRLIFWDGWSFLARGWKCQGFENRFAGSRGLARATNGMAHRYGIKKMAHIQKLVCVVSPRT